MTKSKFFSYKASSREGLAACGEYRVFDCDTTGTLNSL